MNTTPQCGTDEQNDDLLRNYTEREQQRAFERFLKDVESYEQKQDEEAEERFDIHNQ